MAAGRGEIKDLLITIPPGCMKSLLVSVFWPTWTWIQWPESRWMTLSYELGLATRDAVKSRNVLDSPWYRRNWGDRFRMASDQNQKMRYQNDKSGWRIAASMGSRGMGEHPTFIVVDDPLNVIVANSKPERLAVLDCWDGMISTRGRVRDVRRAVIMQRLHQQDLAQHLIDAGGFTHINLCMRHEPARMEPTPLGWTDPRAEEGELLWPELFTEPKVAQIERELGAIRTAGQMQQRPSPEGGAIFTASRFRYYRESQVQEDGTTRRLLSLISSKGGERQVYADE